MNFDGFPTSTDLVRSKSSSGITYTHKHHRTSIGVTEGNSFTTTNDVEDAEFIKKLHKITDKEVITIFHIDKSL
jgi:hypothetical protein